MNNYGKNCKNASGNIADEIKTRISETQSVYRNLHHLWRRTTNTCKRPSSTASFQSQMSKDHWTHLLKAEDNRRGGAPNIFKSIDTTKSLAEII